MAFSILQVKLSEIFTDLNKTYKNIPARMKAEAFKQRVVACFKAWEVSQYLILLTGNRSNFSFNYFRTGRCIPWIS